MLSDHRGILIDRSHVTALNGCRKAAVHLGAIRHELSLIRDGPDERMVEHEFGLSGERDLIDELSRDQVGDHWFDA